MPNSFQKECNDAEDLPFNVTGLSKMWQHLECPLNIGLNQLQFIRKDEKKNMYTFLQHKKHFV